jgi:hypothetical protein
LANIPTEEYGRFYDDERRAFEAAMGGDGARP